MIINMSYSILLSTRYILSNFLFIFNDNLLIYKYKIYVSINILQFHHDSPSFDILVFLNF